MAEFDNYANEYSNEINNSLRFFGKQQDFFTKHKASTVLNKLKEYGLNTDAVSLLDVGCGIGLLHQYITPSITNIHGIDVSEESLKIASDFNRGVIYKHFDGKKFPYADATFDCVICFCVLHHVPVSQWNEFVNEMSRVTKSGGMIIFIEHNWLNPFTQWIVKTCKFDENANLVSPRKLKKLLQACNVHKPSLRYILFTPFSTRFFRFLDRILNFVPFGAQYVMSGIVVRST